MKKMEDKRRFVRQGNVVVLKEHVKPTEMDDKSVVHYIGNIKMQLQKNATDIAGMQNSIIQLKSDSEKLNADLKGLESHEEWAQDLQRSRLKAFVEELTPQYKAEVDVEYKQPDDAVLSPEENARMHNYARLRQLQDKIGRDPKVADKTHSSVISDMIYTNCIIPNPWV